MLVLVFMLLLVLFAIIFLFVIYSKFIRVSDVVARRIEISGYILLIAIAVWTFGIKNIAFGDFYNDGWIYLHNKLHYIFEGITSLHDGKAFDTSSAWTQFNSLYRTDYLDNQLLYVDIIETIFQVLSALCIAIGRLQDIMNNKLEK